MTPIVKGTNPVKVGSSTLQANVEISKEHDVRIQSRHFILASASAMGLVNADIPEWLDASINAAIASGTGDLADIVEGIDTFVRGLDEGVQQQINSLVAADLATNELLTTNVSRLDNDVAAVVTLTGTKVTATEASTITTDILTSQFTTPGSEANAWFTSSSSTITTDIGANTSNVTALIANYNNLNAQLIATNYVDVSGDQWEVGSSKLAIGPNGALTGWSFNDGSGLTSNFTISADQFYIESASIPGYKPFTIDGTNVSFNGIVDFTATNIEGGFPGTTTINGGLVETDTLSAVAIKANTIWTNGTVQSSDFVGYTTGFQLKANATGTFEDPTIYGAYIRSGTIAASTVAFGGARFGSTAGDSFTGQGGHSDSASTSYAASSTPNSYYAYSEILHGPGYASGFLKSRILSTPDSTCLLLLNAQSHVGNGGVINAIQYQINGGTWVSLVSNQNLLNTLTYPSLMAAFDLSLVPSNGYVRFRGSTTYDATYGAGYISIGFILIN